MQRSIALAFIATLFLSTAAWSQPMSILPGGEEPQAQPPVIKAAAEDNLGGGFIEFLFGGPPRSIPRPYAEPDPGREPPPRAAYANTAPAADPAVDDAAPSGTMDPRYQRQEVDYNGPEKPGTVVIDTPNKFLYLVEANGKALRYGVGVGRPGFMWSGVHHITAKKEWPDWVPPKEMLERQPYLPHFMAGGPGNPLGARALYIGSTLYRIHGSNQPWTIGHNVSSGCIRLRNADIIDLYSRVPVGAKVVVM
jgi:lipoprotein-anchoring transpeptidase ErfK/SrfK